MKNIPVTLSVIIFLVTCCSCMKIHYFSDDPVTFDSTRSLVHRGGRTETLPENSYEGFIAALPLMDGVEVDVQMSQDQTIWLSHSYTVEDCGKAVGCFVETHDDVIANIKSCSTQNSEYCRLEDLLKYMAENNIRKFLCIDQKPWTPCDIRSLNVPELMKLEAERIIELGEKYGLTSYLLLETEVPGVLQYAKKRNPEVSTYLTSFGDYDVGMAKALEYNCDGMSFKMDFKDQLDQAKMEVLHQKGLRLLAWNIPDSAYREYLTAIKVDFLMVDLE